MCNNKRIVKMTSHLWFFFFSQMGDYEMTNEYCVSESILFSVLKTGPGELDCSSYSFSSWIGSKPLELAIIFPIELVQTDQANRLILLNPSSWKGRSAALIDCWWSSTTIRDVEWDGKNKVTSPSVVWFTLCIVFLLPREPQAMQEQAENFRSHFPDHIL